MFKNYEKKENTRLAEQDLRSCQKFGMRETASAKRVQV